MDCQKNIKENTVFRIKLLVLIKVLRSVVLYYITRPLYLRAYVLSCDQQQVQQYIPKRHDNTIHKLSLGIKKIIKVILSSTTRIGPIIYIEDPKEAPSMDHAHIKDTEAEEITVADIITTGHPVGNNATSIINLNTSQVSIQQKRDNKYILSINNMPNIQESRKLYQPSITVFLLYGKEQKIFQIIIKKKQTI